MKDMKDRKPENILHFCHRFATDINTYYALGLELGLDGFFIDCNLFNYRNDSLCMCLQHVLKTVRNSCISDEAFYNKLYDAMENIGMKYPYNEYLKNQPAI